MTSLIAENWSHAKLLERAEDRDVNWIIPFGSWLVTRLSLVRQLRVGADCVLRNVV